MLLIIIGSSVLLAMEEPLRDPKSQYMKDLNLASDIFSAVFIAEAVLKIVGMGFLFCGPNSYLRQGWNMLDFFIVIIAIVSWCFSDG
jgi:hypothetical protein